LRRFEGFAKLLALMWATSSREPADAQFSRVRHWPQLDLDISG
jgi:hypothetical protein